MRAPTRRRGRRGVPRETDAPRAGSCLKLAVSTENRLKPFANCLKPFVSTRNAERPSHQTENYFQLRIIFSLVGGRGRVRLCARSEERRVGKECRSGWARYHEKIRRQ